jgi:hypothetical protein
MPRAIFDRPMSPERIPYHLRNKPVTPIEIPRRRRPGPSSLDSPTEQPSSPDLVFEMSPISATFSPSSPPIPRASSAQDEAYEDDEPFMYRVPMFRSFAQEGRTWARPKTSRESIVPSPNSSLGPIIPQSYVCRLERGSPEHDHVAIAEDFGDEYADVSRIQSTTKVTGFFPLKPDQSPAPDLLPKLMGRLSPPPRRMSYSPSPWSIPSGSDTPEEEMSYSQVDPSVFEFQRHLLKRIESKDRFASLRCL